MRQSWLELVKAGQSSVYHLTLWQGPHWVVLTPQLSSTLSPTSTWNMQMACHEYVKQVQLLIHFQNNLFHPKDHQSPDTIHYTIPRHNHKKKDNMPMPLTRLYSPRCRLSWRGGTLSPERRGSEEGPSSGAPS